VLEGDEWRKLLASIPTTTFRDLRDRALIDPHLQLCLGHAAMISASEFV
jgi:hypothetical protein